MRVSACKVFWQEERERPTLQHDFVTLGQRYSLFFSSRDLQSTVLTRFLSLPDIQRKREKGKEGEKEGEKERKREREKERE